MRRSFAACLFLVVSLSVNGTVRAQTPEGDSSSDSAAVAQAVDQFLQAFSDLDWDAFRAAWAAHPTVFFPMDSLPGLAEGRAEVEADFSQVFARARAARARRSPNLPPPGITPHNLRITLYGDAALVTFTLGPPNGRMGRRTLLLVKQEDGWKIAHLHGSTAGRR